MMLTWPDLYYFYTDLQGRPAPPPSSPVTLYWVGPRRRGEVVVSLGSRWLRGWSSGSSTSGRNSSVSNVDIILLLAQLDISHFGLEIIEEKSRSSYNLAGKFQRISHEFHYRAF